LRGQLQFCFEAIRTALAVPQVELGRRSEGPKSLVTRLRAQGRLAARRHAEDRIRLQRAIALVDRLLPGEPSCYRRALLEIRLDAGAAEEALHLGLRVPGGPRSGHAWLGSAAPAERYDVLLDM
jgi:hypothetical protein